MTSKERQPLGMSLKCTSNDKELLSIDFDTEGWDNLRARNAKIVR